jgi:Tfp pilus assembly protein PilO
MSKSRQWATLTAVVCLAVLAAGWFLVIKPQRAHASSLRSQTDGVKAQSAQIRTQVAQLRQEQKDLPAQQKLLSQIATKIPDNPALPALIRQLSAAADGAGVNLLSLAPGQPAMASVTPPARSTSAAATGAARRPAVAAAAPFASIPLTVSVQGSYFNVEQFFSAVESLNRAMLVTGFTLAPASGSSAPAAGSAPSAGAAGTLPPGTLTAQITAQVFESPQVAPAAATVPTSATTTGH